MQDIPKLVGFTPAFGLPDPSPFVLKVYLFLRLHEIDFELVSGDVRKTPKSKLPVLEHKGQVICDSELILDYLAKEYSIKPDEISKEQKAIGNMLTRALDDKMYWGILYSRWMKEPNASLICETFFSEVPSFLRKFVFRMVQKSIKRDLYGQGTGRLDEQQIYDFAEQDVAAIADILGDKDYLFGARMTRYDCTVAAYIAEMIPEQIESPHAPFVKQHPNLVAYWQRVKDKLVIEN